MRKKVAVVLIAITLALLSIGVSRARATTLSVDVTGSNGVGRITSPGLPCPEGEGAYRHYSVESPLSPGALSKLPGTIRSSLDVHYQAPNPAIDFDGVRAFLLGTESHATMSNTRGAVQIRMGAGDCAKPPLTFDGTTVAGSGSWSIPATGGSGAYRQASGSGTFTLTAGVAPGADNPWHLVLNGTINVLQPSLGPLAWNAYWGNLGLDYVSRIVTIDYRVTNAGPGDAYNVRLTKVTSSTKGVTVLTPMPLLLGDLMKGETDLVTVRYQLGLLAPCKLIVLSCQFATTLSVEMPDALDVASTKTQTVTVKAPDLPPPL